MKHALPHACTSACIFLIASAATPVFGNDPESSIWAELLLGRSSVGWISLFSGASGDVDPTVPTIETVINADETIEFAGRAYLNGEWLPTATTTASSPHIVALRDGDPVPDIKAFQTNQIAGYLEPYLDSGDTANIGPRDLLYLVELTTTDPDSGDYNLQDLVFLVTFEQVPVDAESDDYEFDFDDEFDYDDDDDD
ncbi:MAG: hypothetical protein ACQCXQ_06215 [Verrucomicrobiales bacterium]